MMDIVVKAFIEENIEDIQEGNWTDVYHTAFMHLDLTQQGQLTMSLLSAGINPLETIDYIPSYYLSDCQTIDTFDIPSHITCLEEGCFAYSSIKSIVIPPSVTVIGNYAFYESSLLEITIPEETTKIGTTAFDHCSMNLVIVCKQGSFADNYAQEQEFNVRCI